MAGEEQGLRRKKETKGVYVCIKRLLSVREAVDWW